MDKFGKFLQGNASKLVVGIGFLIYNVVFWVILALAVGVDKANATVWISYGFFTLAFGVLLGLTFIRPKNLMSGQVLTSVAAYTYGYIVLSFILNLIFMLVNTNDKGGVATDIVLNVIFLLVYIALFIIAYRRFARVQANDMARETRMEEHRMTNIHVTTVLNMASDAEVKEALSKLRMRVNNSSSHGNDRTKEYEQQFDDQLDVIKDLISAGADKEEVLKNIEQANAILTTRNQVLASTR